TSQYAVGTQASIEQSPPTGTPGGVGAQTPLQHGSPLPSHAVKSQTLSPEQSPATRQGPPAGDAPVKTPLHALSTPCEAESSRSQRGARTASTQARAASAL